LFSLKIVPTPEKLICQLTKTWMATKNEKKLTFLVEEQGLGNLLDMFDIVQDVKNKLN
jgi:hypothetical protein